MFQRKLSARARTALLGSVCAAVIPSLARATVTYDISGTWPGTSATTAATAMASIVADFNAYGDFSNFNFDVTYVSGVPTAQSTYLGQIQVGGSYTDSLLRRVLQHETNHVMGSGTTNNWYNVFNSTGVWTGAAMDALAAQFDGDGTVIRQAGVHYYPYGLNYDTEVTNIDSAIGAETVYMRNIAILYAERQGDGLGNASNPWSATTASLTQSDAVGTSAFNNWGVWSDNYFTHPNAAYSTGNFILRTPVDTYNPTGATPSFTFAGDSLTVNNTNGAAGGLQFNGVGTASVLSFRNLTLNGGYVSQNATAADLFQLAGQVTLLQSPTLNAAQGSISVSASISGSGNLIKAGPFALTLSGGNTYTGNTTISAGTLRLTAAQPIASYSFSNISGTTVVNDGTGGSALNGTFNTNGGSGSISTTGGPQAGLGVLTLNGTGSTVDINSGITSLSGNGTWTVSAWIKTTQAGATIFNKGDGTDWTAGYSTFYLGTANATGSGGLPDAVRYAGAWVSGSTSVTDGNWHLLTYTDAGGTKSVYVDGALSSLSQNQFLNTDNGTEVRIGFAPSGETDGEVATNGSLSGIKFFSSALSAIQVQQLYTGATTSNVLPTTGTVTLAAGAVLDANGVIQTVGALTGPVGSAIKLGNGQLNVSSSATTSFAGNISGAGGSFVKSGSGLLVLSGKNTYTGTTTINGGTLQLAPTVSVTAATPIASYSFAHLLGNIVINDGSGGTAMNGLLNLNGGSGYINPTGGPIASMGALVLNGTGTTVDITSTVTSLSSTSNWTVSTWIKTTQPGATILDKGNGSGWASGYSTFYLGTTSASGAGGIPDVVRYAGGWVSGTTSVDDGAWHLVTYTNAAGTKAIYVDGVLDTLTQNQLTTADTGTKIRIGFAPTNLDGEVPTTGSLSGIAIYNTPLSAAQVAALYTSVVGGSALPTTTDVTVAGASTLDLNGQNQTINSLTGAAGSTVSLGTGTLTVGNTASTIFAGAITGTGGLIVQGTGTLTLGGSNAYIGTTVINPSATLSITAAGALSTATTVTNNGTLAIKAEATVRQLSGTGSLVLGTPTTPAILHLSNAIGASKVAALTLNAGSQLDLASSALIVEAADAPTKASDLTQLTALVTAGSNGGVWNGAGITSVSVAAHPAQFGIAVADNAILNFTTYEGQPVDANSILVTPALYGDTNLDGKVDLTDLNNVLNNLGAVSNAWTSGNFDGAATIDLTDLNDVLNSLGVSGTISNTAGALVTQPVPEPASLGLAITATAGLLLRRRRYPSD